jgi:hypothetical protein
LRQARKAKAAVSAALPKKRAIHFEQHWRSRPSPQPKAGEEVKIIALINHIRFVLAPDAVKPPVGGNIVTEFQKLIDRLRHQALYETKELGIVAKRRLSKCLRSSNYHLMATGAKGAYKFFEMYGLSVLRSYSVVEKEFHQAPLCAYR